MISPSPLEWIRFFSFSSALQLYCNLKTVWCKYCHCQSGNQTFMRERDSGRGVESRSLMRWQLSETAAPLSLSFLNLFSLFFVFSALLFLLLSSFSHYSTYLFHLFTPFSLIYIICTVLLSILTSFTPFLFSSLHIFSSFAKSLIKMNLFYAFKHFLFLSYN